MSGKLYIGVTDNQWYHYLAALRPPEANFWRPGAGSSFQVLSRGELFLFKLHSPLNYVVGGGYFVSYSCLPLSLAWDAFEQRNGAPDYDSLWQKIALYRRGLGPVERDPTIGCIVLAEPFFIPEREWAPAPADWGRSIVQGKSYEVTSEPGRRLLNQIAPWLPPVRVATPDGGVVEKRIGEEGARYGEETVIRPRLGQGGFRVAVIEAYSRRCSATGERVLPALEASHIRPYAADGPHAVENGILLRSDLHNLFDRGYMTITDDHHIEVSERIKTEFHNGKEYLRLHGQALVVTPELAIDRPSPEFIRWHNEHRYRG
jgi:putative restriction endonuclease